MKAFLKVVHRLWVLRHGKRQSSRFNRYEWSLLHPVILWWSLTDCGSYRPSDTCSYLRSQTFKCGRHRSLSWPNIKRPTDWSGNQPVTICLRNRWWTAIINNRFACEFLVVIVYISKYFSKIWWHKLENQSVHSCCHQIFEKQYIYIYIM